MANQSPARRALAAGALAVALLAGCGTPSSTPPDGGNGSNGPTSSSQNPSSQDPVSPSSSTTAPGRSVTAANLLTTEDIYLDPAYQTAVETPEGVGRPTNESYVCLPGDGLASLGATAMLTRNFGYEVTDKELDPYPKSPLKNQPIIYTQALQFPDEAAAVAARSRYVTWIKACPDTLNQKGYSVDTGQSLKPTAIDIDGGQADAGMVAYAKPGATNAELLYWESAGVTQVKDRLMITVSLSWGEDTPGTFDTTDGDFIHPQVILIEESARKLAV
ncbi:MAG TPA: hypothetical protein VM428_07130 [Microlunatus sp.]|nr:hypothetical protein [Microlunatus sp.]